MTTTDNKTTMERQIIPAKPGEEVALIYVESIIRKPTMDDVKIMTVRVLAWIMVKQSGNSRRNEWPHWFMLPVPDTCIDTDWTYGVFMSDRRFDTTHNHLLRRTQFFNGEPGLVGFGPEDACATWEEAKETVLCDATERHETRNQIMAEYRQKKIA